MPEAQFDTATTVYKVYAAASPAEFNFESPAAVTAAGIQQTMISLPKFSGSRYLNVRAVRGTTTYTSGRIFKLDLGAIGSVHRMTGLRRWVGEPISSYIPQSLWNGVHQDKWGNILIAEKLGIVHVLCREDAAAVYCKHRAIGSMYTIAGTDGNADGPGATPAIWTPMGQINGMTSDHNGNIFLADASYRKIRAICYSINSGGFCQGRIAGHSYIVAGSGTLADAADNVAAATASFGVANQMAMSGHNILFGDNDYFRIRLICNDTDGLCSGKTNGNIYSIAGTGVSGDDVDGVATATAIGQPKGLTLDTHGNLIFTDRTAAKIKAICVSTLGICTGKSVGSTYHFAGNGNTDGPDDQPFLSAIGLPGDINNDGADNFLISDNTFGRLRLLCQSTTGMCSGKTAGRIYQYAGAGTVAVDSTNDSPINSAIGNAASIGLPTNGPVYIFGTSTVSGVPIPRLLFICTNTTTYECSGKTVNNIYWASTAVFDGSLPVTASRRFSGDYNINFDSRGNIYTVHSDKRIRVLCIDPDSPGACHQKTTGFYYSVVGNGVISPSVDGTAVDQASFAEVRGVTADADGNIYAAEYMAHRLFVACFNTTITTGACAGKTAGKIYHLMGTGSSGDGSFDVPAAGVAIAYPQTVLVDNLRNIYLSNYQVYTRVRAICFDVTSPGFCQSKTVGNTYNFLGNVAGGCTYGADGTDSTTAATCKNYGMNFDPFGNLLLASYHSQARIYAVCSRTAGNSGVCSGKTDGAFYRLAGTGSDSDGTTGPALTSAMGQGRGVAADANGNVYLEDWRNATRVICNDVVSAGYCQGKTAGTMYRWYGSGVTGGGMASGYLPDGATPTSVGGTGAMIFDASGILLSSRSGVITAHFVAP